MKKNYIAPTQEVIKVACSSFLAASARIDGIDGMGYGGEDYDGTHEPD